MNFLTSVVVLFARPDSNYKNIAGCDVWDEQRDARNWRGGMPVIAHPPCRGWGRLRKFAKFRPGELDLARLAIVNVRQNGGVLEHPAHSSLWNECHLPKPGEFPDAHGGWTLEIEQFQFGHKAEKRTWLYIVGCTADEIPPIPVRTGEPEYCIRPSKKDGKLKIVTKSEREHTPLQLALWLCTLARITGNRESKS